jgi:hypothetical protein
MLFFKIAFSITDNSTRGVPGVRDNSFCSDFSRYTGARREFPQSRFARER